MALDSMKSFFHIDGLTVGDSVCDRAYLQWARRDKSSEMVETPDDLSPPPETSMDPLQLPPPEPEPLAVKPHQQPNQHKRKKRATTTDEELGLSFWFIVILAGFIFYVVMSIVNPTHRP